MANNQLPPCTFSTAECLQWWMFTPVKIYPLYDFGPEMEGRRLPQGEHILQTLRYIYYIVTNENH